MFFTEITFPVAKDAKAVQPVPVRRHIEPLWQMFFQSFL
jgi:hypothetical protein